MLYLIISLPFSAKSFWICWKLYKTGKLAKNGGRCAARFSNENCSSATYSIRRIKKNGEIVPCHGFQKLSVQLR